MTEETGKIRIIAVAGTTASGKSRAAVEIAAMFRGEVVSCDSAQIYRGPAIATAKATPAETAGIRHHMIDIAGPEENYSCADFRRDATLAVEDIASRGMLPVLCGGTGLYLDSLLRPGSLSPAVPDGIRDELSALPAGELWERLERIDPDSARAIHPNNVRRVIRALEIWYGTGVTKTEWDRRSLSGPERLDPVIAVMTYRDRERLYEAIGRRVDKMVEDGLFEELEEWDLPRGCPMANVIGCREGYAVIDGLMTRDEGINEIKKNTRNYAKRQLTWFSEKRYPGAFRVYVDECGEETPARRIADYVGSRIR